jgi:hypothetical protein
VVHGFERDERQPLVDRELRQFLVLNAVRPPPQDLSISHPGEITEYRLGLQQDVALLDQLLARPEAADPRAQLIVADAESGTVTLFEEDAVPHVFRDAA